MCCMSNFKIDISTVFSMSENLKEPSFIIIGMIYLILFAFLLFSNAVFTHPVLKNVLHMSNFKIDISTVFSMSENLKEPSFIIIGMIYLIVAFILFSNAVFTHPVLKTLL